MGDPQQQNIIEHIDFFCERYINLWWGVLTFKPVRKPVSELLQTSPLTSPWMAKFQAVTASVTQNVVQGLNNHKKLKFVVAAAACVAGSASLVSHSTPLILPVLISAACLPVAEHYRHKEEKNGNLSEGDRRRKTAAGILHVVADVVTIGLSLLSAVSQTNIIKAVEDPLVDKLGDVCVAAGVQDLTKSDTFGDTFGDTFYWVAAKVTTSVLTVAALHNAVAAVVPMVAGVYLTVYALGACFKAGQCLLSTNKGARFAATAAAASVLLGWAPSGLTPNQPAGPPVPRVTSPSPTHTVTIPEGGTLWRAVEESGTCTPEPTTQQTQQTQQTCIANVIKALEGGGVDNPNLVYAGETIKVTKTPAGVKVTETPAGVLVSFRGVTAQVSER